MRKILSLFHPTHFWIISDQVSLIFLLMSWKVGILWVICLCLWIPPEAVCNLHSVRPELLGRNELYFLSLFGMPLDIWYSSTKSNHLLCLKYSPILFTTVLSCWILQFAYPQSQPICQWWAVSVGTSSPLRLRKMCRWVALGVTKQNFLLWFL